jgi:mannose-1-phosphate guanylyltransferase
MTARAFVLAAGFGTRLRPLTLHRPKPLVPVCGVPMLAYALALVRRHGIDRAVVNAHYLADQLEAWRGTHEGVEVDVVVEAPEILGTGGGLRNVRDRLAPRFAVVNADILCDVDLSALLDAVPDGGGAMALRPHEVERYGVVAADSTGTIVELTTVASTSPEGPVARDTHFTGVHALHRDALERVPDGFACIVRTAYKTLVPERRVRGVRHDGTWLDVGDPAAYLEANLTALRTTLPLPLDPFPRAAYAKGGRGERGRTEAEVEGTAWVGRGARVANTRLQDAVVGQDASVASGAVLTRCVVWDGVEVPPGRWTDGIWHDGGWHPLAT